MLNRFSRVQLLKLFAVIALTDGYIHHKDDVPHSIRLLTVIDAKPQHELFTFFCKKLYNKIPKTYFPKNYRHYNAKQGMLSELFSVEATKDLYGLSPTFKTTPHEESNKHYLRRTQPTISFLLNEIDALKWAALKIWFDFDGSITPCFKVKRKLENKCNKLYEYYHVQFECDIMLAETNPTLIAGLLHLLNSLKLTARGRTDNRMWSKKGGIVISARESVYKFIKFAIPYTNTKISNKSSRFSGIPKTTIMRAVEAILKNEDICKSKSFKSKEEALKYRLKLKCILSQTIKNIAPSSSGQTAAEF